MASKKQRGLGRDLASLLGNNFPESTRPDQPSLNTTLPSDEKNELRRLPLHVLQTGRYQPRTDMAAAALAGLADSIRSQGVIQPIIVRLVADNQYEIIAGERRWRAAQLAGLDSIPVIVRELNDETASAMALIENLQREDLNPVEEAAAYQRLSEEFGLTHQKIADLIGKSRVAVSNILRLLNLNAEVKVLLEKGDIQMGHARALLGISGDAQTKAAREVVNKRLSVRQTEKLFRHAATASQMPTTKTTIAVDPDTQHLQQDLAEKLGAKVQIQHNTAGKGKLIIHYSSLDELDGILAHIK